MDEEKKSSCMLYCLFCMVYINVSQINPDDELLQS